MNKMVVNHLDKLYVTSDAATILKELEVNHPAAKIIVKATQQQEAEIGDGTNFVVSFSGELMKNAEDLLRMGLHTSNIIEGYKKAGAKAAELLQNDNFIAYKVVDVTNIEEVSRCIASCIMSKQRSYYKTITNLIAKACINVLPKVKEMFNVDNVRVAKILGLGVTDSTIVNGFVIPRNAEGNVRHVKKAVIALFNGGVDLPKTETTGTVLIDKADELVNYSKTEEALMEKAVKELADAGVNVVVSGGAIGDLAMHFLERFNMMVVKVPSKFDARRLCAAVRATPLLQLGAGIDKNKLGHCDIVTIEEIGSTKCLVFKQETDEISKLSTIVVRGSTQNILDDVERAIDDGVNVYKQMCIDGRFLAGAGASELQLCAELEKFGAEQPGLEQYSVKKYAQAFEVIPRTLAENAGFDAMKVVTNLHALHSQGKTFHGVNIDELEPIDAKELNILDHLSVKKRAIEFATNAVTTILSVDQIIMQKAAGGPKLPKQDGPMDQADEGF